MPPPPASADADAFALALDLPPLDDASASALALALALPPLPYAFALASARALAKAPRFLWSAAIAASQTGSQARKLTLSVCRVVNLLLLLRTPTHNASCLRTRLSDKFQMSVSSKPFANSRDRLATCILHWQCSASASDDGGRVLQCLTSPKQVLLTVAQKVTSLEVAIKLGVNLRCSTRAGHQAVG